MVFSREDIPFRFFMSTSMCQIIGNHIGIGTYNSWGFSTCTMTCSHLHLFYPISLRWGRHFEMNDLDGGWGRHFEMNGDWPDG
jgi:hypothetical protein